jgi:hypothetical protein
MAKALSCIIDCIFFKITPLSPLALKCLRHQQPRETKERSCVSKSAREKASCVGGKREETSKTMKNLLDVREPEQERHQLRRDVSDGAEAVEQGGVASSRGGCGAADAAAAAAAAGGSARRGLCEGRDGDGHVKATSGHLAARCMGRGRRKKRSCCCSCCALAPRERLQRRRRARLEEHSGKKTESVDSPRRGDDKTKRREQEKECSVEFSSSLSTRFVGQACLTLSLSQAPPSLLPSRVSCC